MGRQGKLHADSRSRKKTPRLLGKGEDALCARAAGDDATVTAERHVAPDRCSLQRKFNDESLGLAYHDYTSADCTAFLDCAMHIAGLHGMETFTAPNFHIFSWGLENNHQSTNESSTFLMPRGIWG